MDTPDPDEVAIDALYDAIATFCDGKPTKHLIAALAGLLGNIVVTTAPSLSEAEDFTDEFRANIQRRWAARVDPQVN